MLRKNTYRDLNKYKATQRAQTRRYRDRHGASRPRVKWTDAEYWRVLKHDISDAQLAAEIPHSLQAIQHVRHRLRKGEIILQGYDPKRDTQYGTVYQIQKGNSPYEE